MTSDTCISQQLPRSPLNSLASASVNTQVCKANRSSGMEQSRIHQCSLALNTRIPPLTHTHTHTHTHTYTPFVMLAHFAGSLRLDGQIWALPADRPLKIRYLVVPNLTFIHHSPRVWAFRPCAKQKKSVYIHSEVSWCQCCPPLCVHVCACVHVCVGVGVCVYLIEGNGT